MYKKKKNTTQINLNINQKLPTNSVNAFLCPLADHFLKATINDLKSRPHYVEIFQMELSRVMWTLCWHMPFNNV